MSQRTFSDSVICIDNFIIKTMQTDVTLSMLNAFVYGTMNVADLQKIFPVTKN